MLRCIFCVLASYVLFSFVVVFGQDSASDAEVKKRIIYKEKSYYDFEDTLIRGDKPGPEGTSVNRKQRTKFKSSLNLSKSHIPALESSAVDAK